MDRSSRLRIGCLLCIAILPPRCIRKVRSLTLSITTPATLRMASTSCSECAVSRAAHVTSMRSRSCPEAVTSSAVTAPPACSTAVVNWLTEGPPAGTSKRTVIEYETEGRAVTQPILSRQRRPAAAQQLHWGGSRVSDGRSPLTDIALTDRNCQQIGKEVRGAGKGWYTKRCQRRSVLMVVRRCARIGQGKEGYHADAGAQQVRDAAQHLC